MNKIFQKKKMLTEYPEAAHHQKTHKSSNVIVLLPLSHMHTHKLTLQLKYQNSEHVQQTKWKDISNSHINMNEKPTRKCFIFQVSMTTSWCECCGQKAYACESGSVSLVECWRLKEADWNSCIQPKCLMSLIVEQLQVLRESGE